MSQVRDWSLYFIYDPHTGVLTWKRREVPDTAYRKNAWNAQFANTVAGTKTTGPDGEPKCVKVTLFGRDYKAHRIIWEMCYGPIPVGYTPDHKDRDPWNNRKANLRLATPSQNSANTRKPRNNSTGFKGVCYNKKLGRFQSGIRVNGKQVHLGLFDDPSAAHAAYCAAANKHFGDFAQTN